MTGAMNSLPMSSDVLLQQGKLNDIRNKASTQVALEEAAQAFEAVFMNMLMKSMRDASEVLGDDSLMGSSEEKMYRSLMDSQLMGQMSAQGGLGLAEAMIRQLQNPLTIDATLK